MPYVLYTPSTATQSESIPLIVWLHGSGEVSAGPELFLNSGLLKVLNDWSLEGFNAYVLCPHLA
jgi:predicted peptidase